MTPTPSTKVARKRRCKSTTSAGTPCQNYASSRSDYCFFHDPVQAEKRHRATAAGGKKGRRSTLPKDAPESAVTSADQVIKLISRTINQTLRGQIDPKVANCVGYLSGIILKAREQSDIEDRIARIEEELDKQQRQQQ
jgi:hypothetical protein